MYYLINNPGASKWTCTKDHISHTNDPSAPALCGVHTQRYSGTRDNSLEAFRVSLDPAWTLQNACQRCRAIANKGNVAFDNWVAERAAEMRRECDRRDADREQQRAAQQAERAALRHAYYADLGGQLFLCTEEVAREKHAAGFKAFKLEPLS